MDRGSPLYWVVMAFVIIFFIWIIVKVLLPLMGLST